MVFSPPPSPLPPRHPPLPEHSSDEDTSPEVSEKTSEAQSSKHDAPAAPVPSSSSSSSFARTRRRLMVLVVPAILLFVCSTSSFIIRPQDKPEAVGGSDSDPDASQFWGSFTGNFRDPDLPSLPAPAVAAHAPVREALTSFSKHLRGIRHYGYGVGHVRSSYPSVVPDIEPRRLFNGNGNGGEGETFPEALAAVLPTPSSPSIVNEAQTTAPAIPTPAWPVPTPFPQPFDSSLSYNFTSASCLSFFTTQLANETFRECRPFGLLFGTSSDFFAIESNLTELTAVIEGTCNTDPTEDTCIGIMDWMAAQMLLPDVCRADLADKNSIALEALYGFRSYDIYRKAGCLVNPRTNAYCFAEALAGTSPSDLYYYALPLGTPIPGTSPTTPTTSKGAKTSSTTSAAVSEKTFAPSCSSCVSSLMDIFAPYANDSSLLLALTYPPAASAAVQQCGAGYAPGPLVAISSPTPPVPGSGGGGGGGSGSTKNSAEKRTAPFLAQGAGTGVQRALGIASALFAVMIAGTLSLVL